MRGVSHFPPRISEHSGPWRSRVLWSLDGLVGWRESEIFTAPRRQAIGAPLFSNFFVLRRMRRMCVYTCAGHFWSHDSASVCEPPPRPSYSITYAYQGLQANKVICCPCFTDPLGLGSYVNCNTWASCRSMLRNAYGHVGQHLVPIVAPGEPIRSKWWIQVKMVVLR